MESQVFVLSAEQFAEIVSNQELIIQRLEKFDLLVDSVLQLNGYFYLLIFLMLGVGIFYLFYRFLKIFI